jgi:hypothetical protein
MPARGSDTPDFRAIAEPGMLVSNSRKFIYIHLHKCAGTSIEKACGRSIAWNDILLGSTPEGERLQGVYQSLFGLAKHSSAAEVCAVVGRETWDAYYTFATVRNPYAVAVSLYTHAVQVLRRYKRKLREQAAPDAVNGGSHVDSQVWPWNYPGVKALLTVREVRTSFSEFIRSPQLDGWAGFATMRSQLCDATGNQLVQDVFKVEDLETTWPLIAERLGIPGVPLGRANKSIEPGIKYQSFYREEDAELIRERYREDFLSFGYSEVLG